jgi:hippurate hydrolase
MKNILQTCALAASIAAATTYAAPQPLLDVYKHLHANPELSFQEKNTARFMADEFKRLGFKVETAVGGHGLVAVMKNGKGPTVMLRADMDALPVKEQTGLPYASKVEATEQTGQQVNVMHACGHDIHMTSLIGAARELVKQKDQWQGTLMLIGQPAEERGAGARMMLDDGLFTRFPRPDYNLALHVNAALPAGSVSISSGWALANVDSVDITVKGIGGHGAYPHATKDPVVLASSIVMNLQTLVSREVAPIEPAVVTVGSFQAGAKHNVISEEARLQLTVRSYSDEVRKTLLDGIARIAKAQALSFGLPEDKLPVVTIKDEFTPSVWNDPQLAARLSEQFGAMLGEEKVVELDPVMGGEDFSRYGRQDPPIPSVIFWLGTIEQKAYDEYKAGKRRLPSLHSPFYAPDPAPSIETGVKTMSNAALNLFKQ